MFSRISGFSSTCSKCRSRLGRVLPPEITNLQPARPVDRRWLSVAALRTDADNEDPQSVTSNDTGSQTQGIGPLNQAPGSESYRQDNEILKQTKFRRWRPHQAEGLGVNVLGRPAEVLILPTRKRKVAESLPEEAGDQTNPSLQRSLDSELKPVSMTEILRNIDSFKEELEKDTQDFTVAEWKENTRRLAQGFTKTQLEEYLRVSMGIEAPDSKAVDALPRSNSKRKTAAQIMTEVWHWKSPDTQTLNVISDAQPKPTTQGISVPAAKLGYIMLHEKQRLGDLSKTLKVQIDVWKKKRVIRLSGTPTAVENARIRLGQFKSTIQESRLEIPKSIQDYLADGSESAAVLTKLMQKHKLFITKDGDTLNIVGSAKRGVDMVLRDLVVMTSSFHRATPFSFYWEHGDEQAVHAPFYVDDLSQSLSQDKVPFRHISSCSVGQAGDGDALSNGRKVRKLAEKLLKTDRLDQTRLSHFVIAPGALSHDYLADLGQVLFNTAHFSEDTNSLPSASGESSVADTTLILQQALLPQVLAKKDFLSVNNTSTTQKGSKANEPHPFLLSLRLVPAVQSAALPRIEIILRGDDASRGLRQQLSIKRVFAVLDQWQHSILLPSQSLDIVLSRQSNIDLLGIDGTKPAKAYLNILQQLGSQLENAQSSGQSELPPIWMLDMSSLFKKQVVLPLETSQCTTSTPNLEQQTIDDKPKRTKAFERGSSSTYILESPEYLDITSYTSAFAGDRYIDHVVYHTEAMDKPRQRQTLRVCTDPLSGLLHEVQNKEGPKPTNIVEKQRWFKHSVTAAYQVATMLREAEQSAGRATSTAGLINDVSQ